MKQIEFSHGEMLKSLKTSLESEQERPSQWRA